MSGVHWNYLPQLPETFSAVACLPHVSVSQPGNQIKRKARNCLVPQARALGTLDLSTCELSLVAYANQFSVSWARHKVDVR